MLMAIHLQMYSYFPDENGIKIAVDNQLMKINRY